MNTVMPGNVGSHSCTIIRLTAFSVGLHPSKRHPDIGFAEYYGIAEFMELRKSANILELRGSYELRNSDTNWSGGIPWNCQTPKQSSPKNCNETSELWNVLHPIMAQGSELFGISSVVAFPCQAS
jgi:hypothetical protein